MKEPNASCSSSRFIPLLAVLAIGCGGAVKSGIAVGKIASDVGAHAANAPQGGEVCLLEEAVASQPGGPDKPMSEACVKKLDADRLWRGSMRALAAYGRSLEAASFGVDNAGPLYAARTGIDGPDWIKVEGGPENAAREASAQLVSQLSANASEGDPEKMIQEAAPHVKTICDGLTAYLDAQATSLDKMQEEAEKKRLSKTERRCGSVDNKSVCVGDSGTDRVVYSNAFGQLAIMESNHVEARDAVSAFCAAHKKLEEAGGDLKSDETYDGVVSAVKSSRGSSGSSPAPASPTEGDKPKEEPAPKP